MKKTILIICISIISLILIVAFSISPIAKSYIEKNAKTLVGRNVSMDKFSFNIFSGGLRIKNFNLYEADDTSSFVSFDLLDVNLNLLGLLTKKCEIESILISSANIHIIQDEDHFNFDDIMDFFSDTTTVDTTAEEPLDWNVIINNICLERSIFRYSDIKINSEQSIHDISLKIQSIDISKLQTDMGLQFDFENGGSLSTKVTYDTENDKYDLALHISQLQISPILPYVQQYMNIDSLSGILSSNLNINGSIEHIMNFDINGDFHVNDFSAKNPEGKSIVKFNSINTDIEKIDINKSQIILKTLSISGFSSYYEVFKDSSDNITLLFKEDTVSTPDSTKIAENTTDSSSSFSLLVKDLQINNANIQYIDNTLPQRFDYKIGNICISANNFDPDAQNDIQISAVMQNRGKVNVKWIGSVTDITNQNISISLVNMDLRPFSPYTLAMFGNPISEGHLSIQSQNIITNNNLDGTNKINIYNPKVGTKNHSVKSAYNIPLKTGLYVLTDKNSNINLDLPVSGNIDDPSFSYGKIILKTFCNLLVKVAASPFKIINNEEDINEVKISALQTEFSDEEYAKFAQLANLQKSKPELKLYLMQNIYYPSTVETYCEQNLKKNMFVQDTNNHVTAYQANDILIKEKYSAINIKSPELTTYANKMLEEKGLTNYQGLTNTQKAVMLYEPDMKNEIMKDMNARNMLLHSFITTQCNLADTCVSISSNLIENTDTISNSNKYMVEWRCN